MSSLGSSFELGKWRQGAPARGTYTQLVILAAILPSALIGHFGSKPTNLVLCLAAAAWSLIALSPGLRRRPPVMAVFVAGVIAIAFALVLRDPWFGFYAYAGYSYSIVLLPWPWQLAGVAGTAVVAGTSQTAGVNRATPIGVVAYVGIVAGNMLAVCGVTWLLNRLETQGEQRGRMLGELRESNRRLEAALAENAGLHQQLLTQAREAGILDERQRMAREIHDTLAQGLTGIITQLQAAEHAAAHSTGEPAEWRTHFAAATRLARESLSEARRSVDALRPESLETGRLGEALADVAGRWSELNGIEVQVMTTGATRPMRPETELALLRAGQEALANVARHAQATRVGVTLSYLEHEVALDVRDDGRGFDPARIYDAGAGKGAAVPAANGTGPPARGGFGLVAMRQRIEALSGTLQIESEPGAGTGISARVPLTVPLTPLEASP
ncbi:MAG: histidine kinase [Streptosporangiaceae bacterium]